MAKAVIYRLSESKTLALMDLLRIVAERTFGASRAHLRGLSGGEDAPEPMKPHELAERLAEGSVTVLDVRPADEYASGTYHRRAQRDLADLEQILSKLARS